MAVDTAQKRFSMLNFGDGRTPYMLFQTDGAVDLDDRQHLLDCYSGIAFGAVAVVTVRPLVTIGVIDRISDVAGFFWPPWLRRP